MGLSLGHILILLFVLLLFGSKRLPDLGRALGQSIHAFKKGLKGDDDSKNKLDKK
jgi:sec-independent protein translocase protein TatA